MAYLEGALERALDAERIERSGAGLPAAAEIPAAPATDAPAPVSTRPRAVLDPFEVYPQGEDVLRQELGALGPVHLRNIARAYRIAGDGSKPPAMTREELIAAIVAAA